MLAKKENISEIMNNLKIDKNLLQSYIGYLSLLDEKDLLEEYLISVVKEFNPMFVDECVMMNNVVVVPNGF